jgi:type II secretory pathway component PulC
MGLRNRDVITAVNDQPITGPEQAAEFFTKLAEGGDIRIDIMRRNRNRELNLKIE